MKSILTRHIFLFLFMLPVWAVAQNSVDNTFFIRGTLLDEQNKPVPFGNIVLYQSADSALVKGTTSDESGKFALPAKSGTYYLKVSILSYRERTIPVKIMSQDLQLGTLKLKSDTKMLEEVVVKGEKSQMELQLDKRVFNIGTDLSNIGGNASEILDNVPSVTVDVEGNVSLRGSQNVRILIDGRPSGLTGISSPDALRQLQGNLIDRIEVITNPSSRYDAEGEVGIINIILKKQKNEGVTGSFTATVGHPDNYGSSFDINYRKKKVNLFSSYGINYRSRPGVGSSYQSFNTIDTVFSYAESNRRNRGGISHNFRVGMDYYLNDQNIITGSLLYRRSDGRNNSQFRFQDFGPEGELVRTLIREEQEKEPENNIEAALSYRKEFVQKGRTFTADFKLIESDEDELSNFQEGDPAGIVSLRQRSSNTEDERNILFQADYVHPFGKNGKWEAGVKSTVRVLKNDFLVEQQESDADWAVLPRFDNNLIYRENIHAGYLMAGNQFKKFSLQVGLRGEFSDITTELPELAEVNQRKYFNLFPSAHFSYEINKKKAVQLSYSYRLSRPGFRELLPFSGYSNARSLMTGNPNLNPEYTHSMEGGYLLNWESGSMLSSAYYRYRTGVIQRITLVDSVGFSRIFPVNLATENAYGLEFNFSNSVQRWWNLNANFNFYRAITRGYHQDQLLESDTYTWTSRITSKMTFFKQWNFQAGFNYRGPRQIPQGRELSMYSIDLGLSKDVMKGNGTFTLSVRDLLNTRKRRTVIEENGYYSTSSFQWSARQIMLTFNYRLNRSKKEARSREEMGGDNNEEN